MYACLSRRMHVCVYHRRLPEVLVEDRQSLSNAHCFLARLISIRSRDQQLEKLCNRNMPEFQHTATVAEQ